ncbi:MAG: 16S rRNA (cytosine(1402)-N(4))-methyltransferase RsmH [Prevotella sp.]|nr:16S rRNA (cytosine(1402)-N(4))-methyltransferase RsmH [Prevotella sp.]
MIEQTPTYHVPVLLNESIEGLALKENGVYVDVTFGGGGHSKEILRLLKGGKLYSFDQDPDAEENFGKSEETENSFTFIASNFRHLRNWMRYYGELDADDENPKVDGILADLGVSSHHLDDESRGFSFRFDSPIDMRMNKRAGKTAADILNEYDEERLAYIIYIYGEVKQARKLASLIVKQRQTSPYKMTGDLVKTCEQCLPRERAKKEMAKVFQALRIEVNHEMDALTEMLQAAIKVLKPGGRLSVITYHSLEDRIVKNFFKAGNAEGKVKQDLFGRIEAPLRVVNKKIILPSADEQATNPRSRSAKLRIAERI